MDGAEIGVTVGGVAAIGWIVWYFFLGERRRVLATSDAGGVQTVKIVVKGGYDPEVIVLQRDRPARLDFYRDEDASCSDTVVLGEFGISRSLPAFKTTAVEFTPRKAGEFTFTCGMGMLRGKLVVHNWSDK